MKPQHFKEFNEIHEFPKMEGQTENTKVHVRREDGQIVSLWSCGLWKRLVFLFTGRLWIGVTTTGGMPIMWLDCRRTVFVDETKTKKNGMV